MLTLAGSGEVIQNPGVAGHVVAHGGDLTVVGGSDLEMLDGFCAMADIGEDLVARKYDFDRPI